MSAQLPSDTLSRLREEAKHGAVMVDGHYTLALVECAAALKALSAMYAHTWDRVDGVLVMLQGSVERFEDAHSAAREALSKLEAL